jgi:RsmE family RNA methyltransferase
MSKARIYIKPQEIADFIQIEEKAILHKLCSVLRLKKGDEILVFDGKGKEYLYSIEELGEKCILAKKGAIAQKGSFPNKKVILAFPLTREERVDFILQKAT